jgi:hypothetical protein
MSHCWPAMKLRKKRRTNNCLKRGRPRNITLLSQPPQGE